MIVGVVGSRECDERDYCYLENELPANATEIVSGGARGVDTFAKRYADEHDLYYREIRPDYSDRSANGRYAPLVRDKLIVEKADIVYAFWDGESKGTAYTVSHCLNAGKPVKVVLLGGKTVKDSTENPSKVFTK